MVAGTSGILEDLFLPLPASHPPKGIWDHVAEHVQSTEGTGDVFYSIRYALANLRLCNFIPTRRIDRINTALTTAGIGLSLPAFIADTHALKQSCKRLFEVSQLPNADPLKTRKLMQAKKASFLSAVNFTNSAAQVGSFLGYVKALAFTAAHLCIFDGIYYLTSVIADGVELAEECFRLTHSDLFSQASPNRSNLSWILVAKDVASLVISFLALTSLCVASLQGPMFVASWTVLCTFWLCAKLAAEFYNRTVILAKEKPI